MRLGTRAATENPELKVGIAQRDHTPIFLEGSDPGNRLIAYKHRRYQCFIIVSRIAHSAKIYFSTPLTIHY
jgi:hypothetical protein